MSPRLRASSFVLYVEIMSITIGMIVYSIHLESVRNTFSDNQVALAIHTRDSIITGIVATALAAILMCVLYRKSLPVTFGMADSRTIEFAVTVMFVIVLLVALVLFWTTNATSMTIVVALSTVICAPALPWVLDLARRWRSATTKTANKRNSVS